MPHLDCVTDNFDKYQILLTTSNSLTDATNNCLNVDRVRGHFIMAFFFLVFAISEAWSLKPAFHW